MSEAAVPAGADEGRMTLIEHLIELRKRIIRCLIAITAGVVIAWTLYPWIFDFLLHPYKEIAGNNSLTGGKLLQTEPLEAFSVRIKISAYVGIALAMPVILWQVWRFVSPGLYKHERRYALPFILSAIVLFIAGASIAYWTLPKALSWLVDIGGGGFTTAFTAQKYFQLIAYMMLAFGVCFEYPIFLIFLQIAGILPTDTLRQYRRHAIVAIAILVAVATPSNDPISMLALCVPMWFLNEVAIVYGRLRNRRRRRAERQIANEPA